MSGGHRDDTSAAAAAPPGIGPAPAETARSRARAAAGAPACIARSNVGFQLLEKAGWREGTGLGAKAQGPLEPVGAFVKADRRGIGAETLASVEVVGAREGRPTAARQTQTQTQSNRPGVAAAGADAAAAGDGDAAAPTARELSREQVRSRTVAPVMAHPSRLPVLTLTTSPLSLRTAAQLAAHVRKRARDAAIGRRMYREFADTDEGASAPDANPLTRRRTAAGGDRLRDSNPLRGMFAD